MRGAEVVTSYDEVTQSFVAFHDVSRAGFEEMLGRFRYLVTASACAWWLMTDFVLKVPEVAVTRV